MNKFEFGKASGGNLCNFLTKFVIPQVSGNFNLEIEIYFLDFHVSFAPSLECFSCKAC